jgi:hypothetical protein
MKEIIKAVIVPAVTRAIVQVAAGVGVAATDETSIQVAGGLTFAVTLGWSIFEKIKARRAAKKARG